MRVWMLTGDKGATAKMIGLRCGMIPKESLKLKFSDREKQPSQQILVQVLETRVREELLTEIERVKNEVFLCKYQLMISGATMAVILEDLVLQEGVKQLFLEAESVILYRSSPS